MKRRLTVDQRDARTVSTPFTHTLKVALEEVSATNLEAFLDDLRGELIHAVLGSIAEDMVNGAAPIRWCSMLADMLNAPVPKLTMSNNVDAIQDLDDARTLLEQQRLA